MIYLRTSIKCINIIQILYAEWVIPIIFFVNFIIFKLNIWMYNYFVSSILHSQLRMKIILLIFNKRLYIFSR